MGKVRVAVIDAHSVFRAGVCQVLDRSLGCQVIAEGANADDARRIAQQHTPDLMVMDLPGELRRETIRLLLDDCPAMRVLVLTVLDDDRMVSEALQAGVAGYMLKGASATELLEAVQRLKAGEQYVFPALAARLLGAPRPTAVKPTDVFSALTIRESQILEHLCAGLTNKEIGRRLRLSDKTVKHYMTTLFGKLQCRNRLEAALLAKDHLKSRSIH